MVYRQVLYGNVWGQIWHHSVLVSKQKRKCTSSSDVGKAQNPLLCHFTLSWPITNSQSNNPIRPNITIVLSYQLTQCATSPIISIANCAHRVLFILMDISHIYSHPYSSCMFWWKNWSRLDSSFFCVGHVLKHTSCQIPRPYVSRPYILLSLHYNIPIE